MKPTVANQTSSALTPDEGAEELACHAILKHHPHLVNLIHHFDTEAHTYLVLEYCAQGDLYEAIRLDRGPLQTEHVRRFMLQLISAVQHMHANGLYHRDIKPENIFLTEDGSMKLGDFGLATRSLWSYESSVGSDRYMAPEQYDPANIGYSPAKADIWSIGICLLNVLFARNPFVVPTESDVLFADYTRDRQSLFDIFPSMSQDTFDILSIAMALDPAKRDLGALKQAILRAVTFTTDDESFDEFCAEERDVVRASANREPLRTPSIQSLTWMASRSLGPRRCTLPTESSSNWPQFRIRTKRICSLTRASNLVNHGTLVLTTPLHWHRFSIRHMAPSSHWPSSVRVIVTHLDPTLFRSRTPCPLVHLDLSLPCHQSLGRRMILWPRVGATCLKKMRKSRSVRWS